MIEINLLPSRESANAQPQCRPKSQRHQHILVVDDEFIIRRLTSEILISAGYLVTVAEDGAAAWDTLQQTPYDLVITDHIMPNLTGLELIRKIRAAQMSVPVIMATGHFPEEEFANAPWLLPTVTLLKPYTFEELFGAVQEALRTTAIGGDQPAPATNWQSVPSVGETSSVPCFPRLNC